MRKFAIAMVLLVAGALVTGCAPGVTRMADPSDGDFYTEEEYQKLKKDQREAYCADLLSAYGDAQDCVAESGDALDGERTAIAALETSLADIRPQLMGLRSEVEGLQSQIAYFEGLPRMYMVEKGDFLSKISGLEEVYADPNLIYPDWELVIPRDWPRAYTVKEGENLWMIAKRWEIYGDGRMWTEIFEANGDVLSDPNMIRPGQTLTIPR